MGRPGHTPLLPSARDSPSVVQKSAALTSWGDRTTHQRRPRRHDAATAKAIGPRPALPPCTGPKGLGAAPIAQRPTARAATTNAHHGAQRPPRAGEADATSLNPIHWAAKPWRHAQAHNADRPTPTLRPTNSHDGATTTPIGSTPPPTTTIHWAARPGHPAQACNVDRARRPRREPTTATAAHRNDDSDEHCEQRTLAAPSPHD